MSETSQNIAGNQEIDLSQISKKIGGFFESIATRIFKAILFFKRNIIWIGILFISGLVIGFYIDKVSKSYESQIIVCPNFASTDYLYTKIDLINSKIEDNDTVFLKEVVGIKNPDKLSKIEIKPIIDVYKFAENKDKDNNFELLKLMAEDGDIKKIVTENLTSKNYPYHVISFKTNGKTTDDKTVKPILSYLNNSSYFKTIQKQYLKNINIKISENDSIISQINTILNTFSNTANGSQKSDKLVYYNENSQLGDIIKTKNELNYEQGSRRLDLINLDKVIKDNSITLNIKSSESLFAKMKFLLPLLFVFIFSIGGAFKVFYKKQMDKLNS
jgi:hypothetical protein